jgi:UDP-N-acetylglucosamine transferase subunit ALG13
MLFVTVGTSPHPFQRLIDSLTKLPVEIQQEIVFQGAVNPNQEVKFSNSRFLAPSEYNRMLKNADIVICHAGIGTVRECCDLAKKTIIVPRLGKHGEHFNDHQLELVKELSARPLPNMYPLDDFSLLEETIGKVKNAAVADISDKSFGKDLKLEIESTVKEWFSKT